MQKTADWEERVTFKMKNNIGCKMAHILRRLRTFVESNERFGEWKQGVSLGRDMNHLQWGPELKEIWAPEICHPLDII